MAFYTTTAASTPVERMRIDDNGAITMQSTLVAAGLITASAGVTIADGQVLRWATDTILARALKAQFDTLVDHGALKRVPGL